MYWTILRWAVIVALFLSVFLYEIEAFRESVFELIVSALVFLVVVIAIRDIVVFLRNREFPQDTETD